MKIELIRSTMIKMEAHGEGEVLDLEPDLAKKLIQIGKARTYVEPGPIEPEAAPAASMTTDSAAPLVEIGKRGRPRRR